MKILPPHHYSQVNPNESTDFETYSGKNNKGGMVALEMQETYQNHRNSSIETIEKILYDITTVFKRFATIVEEQ